MVGLTIDELTITIDVLMCSCTFLLLDVSARVIVVCRSARSRLRRGRVQDQVGSVNELHRPSRTRLQLRLRFVSVERVRLLPASRARIVTPEIEPGAQKIHC